MSGAHGSMLPAPLCSCDTCPVRCHCDCYGCAVRRLDANLRKTLGWAYGPAKVAARVVGWVLR